MNSSPLQEQPEPLATESFLQPLFYYFLRQSHLAASARLKLTIFHLSLDSAGLIHMHYHVSSLIGHLVLCFYLFAVRRWSQSTPLKDSQLFFTFCFAKFVVELTLIAQAGPKLVILLPKPMKELE